MARIEKMFGRTSGTTGIPLDLYWSRDAVRGFYALFEAPGDSGMECLVLTDGRF